MNVIRAGGVVVCLLLLATPVLAHVPSFPADNTSPERAVVVPDAAKSWSFYDRLSDGGPTYYRFSLAAGQRLRVGTFTPSGGAFTPSVVLMSPAFDGTGEVPARITVPEGMGARVVEGERPRSASYEPFTPSATYRTVDIDRPVEASSTFVVAVYEPRNRSGPVGVTVGYEEAFSAREYLAVPFDLVQIRLWEGQHPLVVAGPWLVALLGVAALLRNRWTDRWERPLGRVGLAGASALLVGTGVATAVQMGLSLARTGPTAGAVVTGVFVVVPLVCGVWALRVALRDQLVVGPRTRVGLALAGVASLATWGGFVVGPAVLLVVAVLPANAEAG